MERYSQFRDRGTGITPFFPITQKPAGIYLPIYIFLFLLRLPFFIFGTILLLLYHWIPIRAFKRGLLWIILGISGVWWIDFHVDGVKKGSFTKQHVASVPGPTNVIAASFASPIDGLYLAAAFDPIFTVSYPHTKQVRILSLLGCIFQALATPEEYPPKNSNMTDIKSLIAKNKKRAIVVFPECTTTNGKGILPLSPSLLTSPHGTKIFPLHLRYVSDYLTTPLPGCYLTFIWNLLSRPTHSIRVKIAEVVHYSVAPSAEKCKQDQYSANDTYLLGTNINKPVCFEKLNSTDSQSQIFYQEEKNTLDMIAEALARLGRVRRVRLTVKDKIAFIGAWNKKR